MKPHMNTPAIMMAAVGEPGMPSTSMGRMAPVPAALLAASGATTPSTTPVPKRSGCLEILRAKPYPMNEPGVAPAPGRIPTTKPSRLQPAASHLCLNTAEAPAVMSCSPSLAARVISSIWTL